MFYKVISMWLHPLCLIICALTVALLAFRTVYLMYLIQKGKRSVDLKMKTNVKTIIVIGSGGHTMEMLRLVKHLDANKFYPRIYIMASSDESSESKIVEVETCSEAGDNSWDPNYKIVKIPRSRRVGQSYVTSFFTTLYSTLLSIPIIVGEDPDLVLCNGPGTCIPVCVIAFLMRVFWLSNNVIIFIESICRVKSLSLSGKILMYFADEIIVEWMELQNKYPRTKYIGRL